MSEYVTGSYKDRLKHANPKKTRCYCTQMAVGMLYNEGEVVVVGSQASFGMELTPIVPSDHFSIWCEDARWHQVVEEASLHPVRTARPRPRQEAHDCSLRLCTTKNCYVQWRDRHDGDLCDEDDVGKLSPLLLCMPPCSNRR
jgi:hypothetical protein